MADQRAPELGELQDPLRPPSVPIPEGARDLTMEEQRKRQECELALQSLFPDMCPRYLRRTAEEHSFDRDNAVHHVLDVMLAGKPYDKRPLKRKRSENNVVDQIDPFVKYYNLERRQEYKDYRDVKFMRKILEQRFPLAKKEDIKTVLHRHHTCLLPAYLALADIEAEWRVNGDKSVYRRKKRASKKDPEFPLEDVDRLIASNNDPRQRALLEEYVAARQIEMARSSKLEMDKRAEEELAQAKAAGTLVECGCCFEESIPRNLVYCNGESKHAFCIDCAKKNANSVIGLSKYELQCMSMDACNGGFSLAERTKFLDEKLTIALDRIEFETVLRLAALENLAQCPFCPFAAEYPPIEQNKEFHCLSDECKKVSCRLCNKNSHLPKTCEEFARDQGFSARRTIEEAMSDALIRKCNKCATPFIKEDGCNKMTCPRRQCGHVQCYVCHKECTYAHFDDVARGGKAGNCPLFDKHEERHLAEVNQAEAAARQRVLQQNPDVAQNHLQFDMAEKVARDDARRVRRANRPPHAPLEALGVEQELPAFLRRFQEQGGRLDEMRRHIDYLGGNQYGRDDFARLLGMDLQEPRVPQGAAQPQQAGQEAQQHQDRRAAARAARRAARAEQIQEAQQAPQPPVPVGQPAQQQPQELAQQRPRQEAREAQQAQPQAIQPGAFQYGVAQQAPEAQLQAVRQANFERQQVQNNVVQQAAGAQEQAFQFQFGLVQDAAARRAAQHAAERAAWDAYRAQRNYWIQYRLAQNGAAQQAPGARQQAHQQQDLQLGEVQNGAAQQRPLQYGVVQNEANQQGPIPQPRAHNQGGFDYDAFRRGFENGFQNGAAHAAVNQQSPAAVQPEAHQQPGAPHNGEAQPGFRHEAAQQALGARQQPLRYGAGVPRFRHEPAQGAVGHEGAVNPANAHQAVNGINFFHAQPLQHRQRVYQQQLQGRRGLYANVGLGAQQQINNAGAEHALAAWNRINGGPRAHSMPVGGPLPINFVHPEARIVPHAYLGYNWGPNFQAQRPAIEGGQGAAAVEEERDDQAAQ